MVEIVQVNLRSVSAEPTSEPSHRQKDGMAKTWRLQGVVTAVGCDKALS